MITKLVRRLTSWAWRYEIQTLNGLAKLKKLEMDEHGMDLLFEQDPALAQYIGKAFASMVSASVNYTEMQFTMHPKYAGKWQTLTVLIQKHPGKTPHQMREQAERERDELRGRLEKLIIDP